MEKEREYNSKHTSRATPPFGLLSSPISISGAILVLTMRVCTPSLFITRSMSACILVIYSWHQVYSHDMYKDIDQPLARTSG